MARHASNHLLRLRDKSIILLHLLRTVLLAPNAIAPVGLTHAWNEGLAPLKRPTKRSTHSWCRHHSAQVFLIRANDALSHKARF